MIWLNIIFSLLTTGLLFLMFKSKIQWFDFAVPLAPCIIVNILVPYTIEKSLTADTEYWTGYITEATYYEPWNETVPCTHAKYRTQCTTDSKGKSSCTQVFDGWEHPYDVDYHPAYWDMQDNTGHKFDISKVSFEGFSTRWQSKEFVNLHRHYHSINGNKYVAHFNNLDKDMEVVSHTHSYENRVQASKSVFNYKEVSKQEKEDNKLFDYPKLDSNHRCPMTLGHVQTSEDAERKLNIWNAKWGNDKQLRVWLLVFVDKPLEAGYLQEAYWKGGNKNELVIMCGINSVNEVQWGYVCSWCKNEELKIEIRNSIYEQKILNLNELLDKIKPIIDEKWERRHFKEFEYVKVDMPTYYVLWVYLGSIVYCILYSGIRYIIWKKQ